MIAASSGVPFDGRGHHAIAKTRIWRERVRVIRRDDETAIILQPAVQPGTRRAVVARCRVNQLVIGRKCSGITGGYLIIAGIAGRYDGRGAGAIGSLTYFGEDGRVRRAVLDLRDSHG